MRTRTLWILLGAVIVGTFLILGLVGGEVYRQAPPLPARIVAPEGEVLATRESILDGQQVWQTMGGQHVGSVWGHGAYQAPDWSADWLHREAVILLETWSQAEHGQPFESLEPEPRAALEARLRTELRTNTHDAQTGTVTVSAARAAAIAQVADHYARLFGGAPELAELRESYALAERPVANTAALTDFFLWTAWACATERPGQAVSYTNNWPHEPLIGNVPSTANLMWSFVSIVLLLAGIAALVWYKAFRDRHEELPAAPPRDPLSETALTPSMKVAVGFGVVAVGLFIVQVLLGALTAHYTVEGQDFFGLPLGELLPYALTRTWHVQLAVLWIATAFLGTGLFLAPAVGGAEPKGQALGASVLLGALVVVVLGTLTGQWLAISGRVSGDLAFLFGHQGYEYVELGRVWQIALWAGLGLWLWLVARALWPALTRPGAQRTIVLLFAGAAVAIGLFFGAGLMFGARSHLSVAEYWRWWVVHLWVEGFFEVFATAVIAFIFARLGLVRAASAGRAAVWSTAIFLFGGIPGTFHHLYFSGTPVAVLAVGATFSALEVVPLVLIGFEAFETLRLGERAPWMQRYRWPILFFVGVAFWNLVGAGLFGFLINPPISLYYMQGLNTTPVHAHTALFGVYGLLSLGMILVMLRRLDIRRPWKDGALRVAFWGMNLGLGLMVALSLLPIGILQTVASVESGLWFARSAEFLQQPLLENLRWLRIVGDTVFLSGVAAFAWFVVGLWRGHSYVAESASAPELVAAQ